MDRNWRAWRRCSVVAVLGAVIAVLGVAAPAGATLRASLAMDQPGGGGTDVFLGDPLDATASTPAPAGVNTRGFDEPAGLSSNGMRLLVKGFAADGFTTRLSLVTLPNGDMAQVP